jgi:hypothetical protein
MKSGIIWLRFVRCAAAHQTHYFSLNPSGTALGNQTKHYFRQHKDRSLQRVESYAGP